MNYSNCTVAELAQHVMDSTCQSVSQTLAYHQSKGHQDIVDKIKEARKMAKKAKLVILLESLV